MNKRILHAWGVLWVLLPLLDACAGAVSWVVVAQVLSGVTWESAGATAEGPSSIRNPHGFAAPSA